MSVDAVSTIVAVKDGFVDALQAATWPGTAPTIFYGFPATEELPLECVIVGGTNDAERTWRTMAGSRPGADETYALECVLSVVVESDGTAQRAANQRAAELFRALIDVVVSNLATTTTGLFGVPAARFPEFSSVSFEELATPATNEALVSFLLRITARV